MSIQANLIGFGPFSKDIAKYLDYPEEWYKETDEGAIVMVTLFQCEVRSAVEALAEALGIESFHDFNKFFIRRGPEDLKELEKFDVEHGISMKDGGNMEAFKVLRDKGFKFFFNLDA
jgi:hypothetical protein